MILACVGCRLDLILLSLNFWDYVLKTTCLLSINFLCFMPVFSLLVDTCLILEFH